MRFALPVLLENTRALPADLFAPCAPGGHTLHPSDPVHALRVHLEGTEQVWGRLLQRYAWIAPLASIPAQPRVPPPALCVRMGKLQQRQPLSAPLAHLADFKTLHPRRLALIVLLERSMGLLVAGR